MVAIYIYSLGDQAFYGCHIAIRCSTEESLFSIPYKTSTHEQNEEKQDAHTKYTHGRTTNAQKHNDWLQPWFL